MKKMKNLSKILLLSLILFPTENVISQIIDFADLELKEYLINELCIDTTNNGFGDIDADLNNDNEIQFTEANSILNIQINDLEDNYLIKSVKDINQFENLNFLRIVQTDSITEISNLVLDSLKTLWIGSCASLRIVDISNLTGLTEDFRVEDIDTLDYLNIKNGSIPEYFSLFYSENIHYACVDSIAAEYDEVAWRMISGLPTIDNCIPLTTSIQHNETSQNELIKLYPIPTAGIIEINTKLLIETVNIFDLKGTLKNIIPVVNNQIDISHFIPGVYILKIKTENGIINKKVFKR